MESDFIGCSDNGVALGDLTLLSAEICYHGSRNDKQTLSDPLQAHLNSFPTGTQTQID